MVSSEPKTLSGLQEHATTMDRDLRMAEHENNIGASDEWFTPPEIFTALKLQFDLDPCSPGPGHWVPANRVFTKEDDGLRHTWIGRVFMNPPFGGRNGHVPWLKRFLDHGNGVAIVRAYTSSAWWHECMPRAEAILFPKGKTQFIRPDGSIGKSPGHGVVLIGMGETNIRALKRSGLGMVWDLRNGKTKVATENRSRDRKQVNRDKTQISNREIRPRAQRHV